MVCKNRTKVGRKVPRVILQAVLQDYGHSGQAEAKIPIYRMIELHQRAEQTTI